jgi:hypothetical protein
MDLMISKTHLSFKHKMIFKWIKHRMNHHKTNKNQRNRQVKKMIGVGDKLIIMIMTVSKNSMRVKKLNKRASGRLLEVIKKKKKIMMRALRIYKKEQTLEILSL